MKALVVQVTFFIILLAPLAGANLNGTSQITATSMASRHLAYLVRVAFPLSFAGNSLIIYVIWRRCFGLEGFVPENFILISLCMNNILTSGANFCISFTNWLCRKCLAVFINIIVLPLISLSLMNATLLVINRYIYCTTDIFAGFYFYRKKVIIYICLLSVVSYLLYFVEFMLHRNTTPDSARSICFLILSATEIATMLVFQFLLMKFASRKATIDPGTGQAATTEHNELIKKLKRTCFTVANAFVYMMVFSPYICGNIASFVASIETASVINRVAFIPMFLQPLLDPIIQIITIKRVRDGCSAQLSALNSAILSACGYS